MFYVSLTYFFNLIYVSLSFYLPVYLFLVSRFSFSFFNSFILLYRFTFFDLYFLFLFYFLFVFINMFGFLLTDIFMFFIFLDFFGLFIDMISHEQVYYSLHTLPFPCFQFLRIKLVSTLFLLLSKVEEFWISGSSQVYLTVLVSLLNYQILSLWRCVVIWWSLR